MEWNDSGSWLQIEVCLHLLPLEKKRKNLISIPFLQLDLCESPKFRSNQMSSWKTILLRAMKYKHKDNTPAPEITHELC